MNNKYAYFVPREAHAKGNLTNGILYIQFANPTIERRSHADIAVHEVIGRQIQLQPSDIETTNIPDELADFIAVPLQVRQPVTGPTINP